MSLSIDEQKAAIRRQVWTLLEERGVARFPRPILGRIPNFEGAELAAARLAALPEFERARVVKVNPDAPQRPVRYRVLAAGKVLLTPTPRLRSGFLVVDPAALSKSRCLEAASIGGAFRFGRPVRLDELPRVDLVVAGSVAVAPSGARLGKGGGYSELEYGVLRELGLLTSQVPVWTTVHELQLVPEVPMEAFDVPVDRVVTPSRVLECGGGLAKPRGILWEWVSAEQLAAMPVLGELRGRVGA